MKKYFWKLWLRPNHLTKSVDNDYTGEVSTSKKTIRNKDIAKEIKEEGSEYQLGTLEDIIGKYNIKVLQNLLKGNSVLTGFCQLTPQVKGAWIGKTAVYDSEKHKITLEIIPSAEMRVALKEDVGLDILGVKESGAIIGLVTDEATGETDGSITIGKVIRIEGEKIKTEGDEAGIFFVNSEGTAFPVTDRLIENRPKTILAHVPDNLQPGQYTLKIITRFTGSSDLLKEPRTIEYDKLLIVA